MPKPSPDHRPSWRDPNLLVIRNYRMADGSQLHEVDPAYESRYREHLLSTTTQPSWKNDPTYDLKRKR